MSAASRSVRAFIRFFLHPEEPVTESGSPLNVRDLLSNSMFRSFRSADDRQRQQSLKPHDENLLQKMIEIVYRHLSDPDFDTRVATKEAGLSRMHLNRRLQAITGCSTHNFICALRFRKARELLRQKSLRVSDVAHAVGFRSPSHFAKAFRKRFGLSPTEFMQEERMRD